MAALNVNVRSSTSRKSAAAAVHIQSSLHGGWRWFDSWNKGTPHHTFFSSFATKEPSKAAAPESFLNLNRREMEDPWGQWEPAVFTWEEVSLSFFPFPLTLGSHYNSGIPPDIFMTLFILIHGSLFVLEQPSKKKNSSKCHFSLAHEMFHHGLCLTSYHLAKLLPWARV